MRSFFLILISIFPLMSFAQNKPCQFNAETMQFSGSPVEQARCLLRPNQIGGILSDELNRLPKLLENLIGKRIKIKKEKLRTYLQKINLNEDALGGSLDEPLTKAKISNGQEIIALYFLIHDTSTPNYLNNDFPVEINEKSWKYNNLEIWLKNPVAHIFINRLGDSITTTPFNETVRKGWGTKFAREFLKENGKGLQLHIELIQPRKSKAEMFKGNDAVAPTPGFTEEQYQRLALIYICASIRRGNWLIPAYHSAMDAGIKDAHDDPQNFELEKFADILKELIEKIN